MDYFAYLIFRFFKSLFSVIPFRILYLFSDFCSLLLQYVFRYRSSTIERNLKTAFPIKSKRRRKQITRQYYKYLCDVILEGFKGYSLNTQQLLERYECLNPEIAHPYFDNGQDIIIALSHYCNWEWGTQAASSVFKHDVATFYKPMSNKYIDVYLQKLRKQRNMELLSIYKFHRVQRNLNEKPKAYFMVSDQSPSNSEKAVWTNFLNQDTACFRGIENYARLFNIPVFYLDVQRMKRGYYTVKMDVLCTTPTLSCKDEITQLYMNKLESVITDKPEYWLWSHRRWKARRA